LRIINKETSQQVTLKALFFSDTIRVEIEDGVTEEPDKFYFPPDVIQFIINSLNEK